MQTRYLALAVLLMCPAPAAAEWHLKPFVGLTLGGQTTFVDVEKAASKPNRAFGVTTVLLGDVFGVDADVGTAPGFFESGDQDLVSSSRVTTVTGDVVVAVPKRLAEYSLRPYFVAGFGVMHVQSASFQGAFPFASTLKVSDFGFGATGFLNKRVGLSWEARRFQSIGGQQKGNTFTDEQLSFWRLDMAVTIRYGK